MPYYRLYSLNPSSGHIDRVEEIDAANDGAAVALVTDREHGVAVELWQEGRKLLHLPKPPEVSVPSAPIGLQPAHSG